MASTLYARYRVNFETNEGNPFTLVVFDSEFSGSTTEVRTDNVVIESNYENVISDNLLNFSLITTESIDFSELFTPNIFKFKVNLYNDNLTANYQNYTPMYSGYLKTEVYEKEIDKTYNKINCVAYSLASILKRIKFLDLNNNKYNIPISVGDIIRNAIKKSSIDINALCVYEDLASSQLTTTTTYIDKFLINPKYYYKNNEIPDYYTVLSNILNSIGYKLALSNENMFKCVLFSDYSIKSQTNGKYYSYQNGSFNFIGNTPPKTVEYKNDNYVKPHSRVISYKPAYNTITFKTKYNVDGDLIVKNDLLKDEKNLNLVTQITYNNGGDSSYDYTVYKYNNSNYWTLGTSGAGGYLCNKKGIGTKNSESSENYLSYRYANTNDVLNSYLNKYLIGKYKYETPIILKDNSIINNYVLNINVKARLVTRDFPEIEPFPKDGTNKDVKFHRFIIGYTIKLGSKYYNTTNGTWGDTITYNWLEFATEKNKNVTPLNDEIVNTVSKLRINYPEIPTGIYGEFEIGFYNNIYAYRLSDVNEYYDDRQYVKEIQIHSVNVSVCPAYTYAETEVYPPDITKKIVEYTPLNKIDESDVYTAYIDENWVNSKELKIEMVSNSSGVPIIGNTLLYYNNGYFYLNKFTINGKFSDVGIEKVFIWKNINSLYKPFELISSKFYNTSYENGYFFPYAKYVDGLKNYNLSKYTWNITKSNGEFILNELSDYSKTL